MAEQPDIYNRPAELLQRLIRFDTTNPPGNEKACIQFIDELLQQAGFQTTILSRDPNRPNIIAKLKGQSHAPGILLYGHVDVVTTANQNWTHPPFEANIIDNKVWGRGALDMKGGVAMMLSAFLKAKAESLQPAGDVTLAIVSDEEAGGDFGARFLVENHADLFKGIRYAIGEFGGFSMYIAGKKFYPIQVAEKKISWLKATVSGPGGHASFPVRNGTMARAGKMLTHLNETRLPIHINPIVKDMFMTIADHVSEPYSSQIRQILNPELSDSIVGQLGNQGIMFEAMLRNTANPTIVRGGNKVNVVPSEIEFEFDGRLLPEFTPDDLIRELHKITGEDIHFELVRYDEASGKPDLGWFDTLSGILQDADPTGIPIPFLLPAVTDARFFSRIGIQTYGFLPMDLPQDFNFLGTIHNADERIPVASLDFGTSAIFTALQRIQ